MWKRSERGKELVHLFQDHPFVPPSLKQFKYDWEPFLFFFLKGAPINFIFSTKKKVSWRQIPALGSPSQMSGPIRRDGRHGETSFSFLHHHGTIVKKVRFKPDRKKMSSSDYLMIVYKAKKKTWSSTLIAHLLILFFRIFLEFFLKKGRWKVKWLGV